MFYNKNIDELENELQTSNKGLTNEEVNIRQQKYGKNILPKKESDSIFKIFLMNSKIQCLFYCYLQFLLL